MSFTEQEIEEFKTEARELLDVGERGLLGLDQGADFRECFDSIFRSFHNLKGAAGMMELTELQAHTHELESILMQFKESGTLPKPYIDLFLRGIDGARTLLEGHSIQFQYALQSAVQAPPLQKADAPTAETVTLPALEEFMSECDEGLERFSKILRKIESGEADAESFNEIYREIHSLKGAAYLFGFPVMGDVAHALESALEPFRSGVLVPNRTFVDGLYKAVEVIEADLKSAKCGVANDAAKADAPSVIDNLNRAMAEVNPHPATVLTSEASVAVSEPTREPAHDTSPESSSIRVPVTLLDSLMTLMGEMVLVRNQVIQYSNDTEDLDFLNLSQRLNAVTNEIQGEMMKTRMQAVGHIFNKFHRVVRDLSSELSKKITLHLEGVETELDKSLLEAIKDPLTHIVRNSCDHGIETPDVRRAKGKAEVGSISVKSYHEGGQVVIEVSDDGKGLDRNVLLKKAIEKGLINESQSAKMTEPEIMNLIFAPGFSTAAKVTNVSGRGVGMDVVRTNIERIGGSVELKSLVGHGTVIRLQIPLTLAIVPALIIKSAEGKFAIPQVKLIELVRIDQTSAHRIEFLQGTPVYRLRGQLLPIIDLSSVLTRRKREFEADPVLNIAVLNAGTHSFGLIVEEIDDTADIVVKPLSQLLKSLLIYSGATILGDGSVALILDVQGLAKVAQLKSDGVEKSKSLSQIDEERLAKSRLENQDFLLVRLNSATKHAFVLSFVHRLEEIERSAIEFSGSQRVVRYRGGILPIVSLNHSLQYPFSAAQETGLLNLVVVERGDHLFGLEVDEILDTLSTTAETDTKINTKRGLLGNINTGEELIVIVDPYEMISMSFPEFNQNVEEKKPAAIAQSGAITSRKLLLVEDSVFFRRLVKGVLEEAGHTVVTAIDGKDAIELLARTKSPFDLIISDIEMPRVNGFEFAVSVRAHQTHAKTPLLALSSRRDKHHIAEGQKAGFDLYLEKMKPEVLLGAIEDLTTSTSSATRKKAA